MTQGENLNVPLRIVSLQVKLKREFGLGNLVEKWYITIGNIKGNVVTIDLTNQLLAEQGLVACQLEFIEAESSVSSYELY